MIGAIARAMLLDLLRDRAALLMAFVLPAAFFMIFAQIFTATASGEFTLRVLVVDAARNDSSVRLMAALASQPQLRLRQAGTPDRDDLVARLRAGGPDVGLVLRPDVSGEGVIVEILSDPTRGAATRLLEGQIRSVWARALPDRMVAELVSELEERFLVLTEQQRRAVAAGVAALRDDAVAADLVPGPVVTIAPVYQSTAQGVQEVAYAAGAVSFMFLLFASVHGALSLLEDETSGILDRVLAGPGGIDVLVYGKFAYLLAQGVVQVAVIFLIAWLIWDVALLARFGGWLLVTVSAAAAAAGLAMLLASASGSRRQAQTTATLVILVMSAIGGSMVPRYVMPASFQALGWLTPNTWALEAYSAAMWRDAGWSAVIWPASMLLVCGIAALTAALLLARRRAVG